MHDAEKTNGPLRCRERAVEQKENVVESGQRALSTMPRR
jgi:hypothetical protein